jgi:capsular polysaccharide biosynthesis protein
MRRRSVFIFDSTYPSPDLALPIDETQPHIVVSDREIEPPPGHDTLQLDEQSSFSTFVKNLQLLRAAWRKENGRECILIAAPSVRKPQLLLNILFAVSLSRNVLLFDGVSSKSLAGSWRLILRTGVSVLRSRVFGGMKARFRGYQFNRSIKSQSDLATPEGRLFGVYGRSRSFSLPLDSVVGEPDGPSIYGDFTRGFYLPTLSNRRQRYTVQTTRHWLRDIILHTEEVRGSPERFLFKDGRILDYPYLLITRDRRNESLFVSTRSETRSIERGIDMLSFTTSYYHWLVDGVPRILDLIDDGIDLDQYPLILPPLEMFQRQLLELLGISPDRQVVTVRNGDWCHVRECVFPTANFPFAAPALDDYWTQSNGHTLRRIRERILARLPITTVENSTASKRIYISRDKALRRKFTVDTEATVRSILESEGFQTIFLECLPWAEQVRLLSGAEFIAGLHGAGLANVLFSKCGTLLEIQNPLEARAYFALMARELQMNYAYIIGGLSGHSSNFDNITIDPQALRDMLGRLDKGTRVDGDHRK